jgi:hypothetical protein
LLKESARIRINNIDSWHTKIFCIIFIFRNEVENKLLGE